MIIQLILKKKMLSNLLNFSLDVILKLIYIYIYDWKKNTSVVVWNVILEYFIIIRKITGALKFCTDISKYNT